MTEGKKSNTMLAIAGAGLLIGAAILYFAANRTDEEEVEDQVDLTELLTERKLMEVKKQGNMLDPQYFLQLLQLVGEQT